MGQQFRLVDVVENRQRARFNRRQVGCVAHRVGVPPQPLGQLRQSVALRETFELRQHPGRCRPSRPALLPGSRSQVPARRPAATARRHRADSFARHDPTAAGGIELGVSMGVLNGHARLFLPAQPVDRRDDPHPVGDQCAVQEFAQLLMPADEVRIAAPRLCRPGANSASKQRSSRVAIRLSRTSSCWARVRMWSASSCGWRFNSSRRSAASNWARISGPLANQGAEVERRLGVKAAGRHGVVRVLIKLPPPHLGRDPIQPVGDGLIRTQLLLELVQMGGIRSGHSRNCLKIHDSNALIAAGLEMFQGRYSSNSRSNSAIECSWATETPGITATSAAPPPIACTIFSGIDLFQVKEDAERSTRVSSMQGLNGANKRCHPSDIAAFLGQIVRSRAR